MLSTIAILAQLVMAIIKLFSKTPQEARADVLRSCVLRVSELERAVEEGKKSGDYGALEDVINS